MPLCLTLTDRGRVSSATLEGPGDVTQFAEAALTLYQRANPAPYRRRDLMVELDHGVLCQDGDAIELYVSRARFATKPKRDGAKPRWGRWHELTVERMEATP